METKINIAAILKDKPQGTKLYDWLHNIDVELDTISTTDTETVVWCTNETNNNTTCHRGYSEFGTERGYPDGLQILFPSKEMRDWTKFSWKKGDVLVNEDGSVHIIFEKFEDDAYTMFSGRYYYSKDGKKAYSYFIECNNVITEEFTIETEDAAQTYISTIEERLGGKLNRESLEVEKTQPEFKDGDIVFVECEKGLVETTFIYKMNDVIDIHDEAQCYAAIFNKENKSTTCGSVLTYGRTLRFATDSEKQQLFDALAKEAKAWDAEKKMIVDLKPKVELKPFDKVLVRDFSRDKWSISFFSFKKEDCYVCINHCSWNQCIPYIGNESLLGTTNNVEG